MAKKNDPALYESNYERRIGDRYFTAPWLTQALLSVAEAQLVTIDNVDVPLWEPAAGRGDIAEVLEDHLNQPILCTDINISEMDHGAFQCFKSDFLTDKEAFFREPEIGAIITNPPYYKANHNGRYCSMAEHFIRRAMDYNPVFMAFLVRSEFIHAETRRDLFLRAPIPFAYEIMLTTRPYWDWWYLDKMTQAELDERKGPRHYYSWLVWDQRWDVPSTSYHVSKADAEEWANGR